MARPRCRGRRSRYAIKSPLVEREPEVEVKPEAAAHDDNIDLARIASFDRLVARLRSELPESLGLVERRPRRFAVALVSGEGAYGRIRREVGSLSAREDGTVAGLVVEKDDGTGKLGNLHGADFAFVVTKEELAGIAAEVAELKSAGRLPCVVSSSPIGCAEVLRDQLRARARARGEDELPLYVFRDPTGTQVLFAQQRVFDSEGGKHDVPWTRWSDGQWRNCEFIHGLSLSTDSTTSPSFGFRRSSTTTAPSSPTDIATVSSRRRS